jgi:hypothetical protein
LDARLSNLRLCTDSGNQHNRLQFSAGKTGLVGVSTFSSRGVEYVSAIWADKDGQRHAENFAIAQYGSYENAIANAYNKRLEMEPVSGYIASPIAQPAMPANGRRVLRRKMKTKSNTGYAGISASKDRTLLQVALKHPLAPNKPNLHKALTVSMFDGGYDEALATAIALYASFEAIVDADLAAMTNDEVEAYYAAKKQRREENKRTFHERLANMTAEERAKRVARLEAAKKRDKERERLLLDALSPEERARKEAKRAQRRTYQRRDLSSLPMAERIADAKARSKINNERYRAARKQAAAAANAPAPPLVDDEKPPWDPRDAAPPQRAEKRGRDDADADADADAPEAKRARVVDETF